MNILEITDVIMFSSEFPNEVAVKCVVSKHQAQVLMPLTQAIEIMVDERMRYREAELLNTMDSVIDQRMNAFTIPKIVP